MTGHARVCGRQTGMWPIDDRAVAIAAIDAETADVMFVAERHLLRRRVNAGAGVIVRASECYYHNETCAEQGGAPQPRWIAFWERGDWTYPASIDLLFVGLLATSILVLALLLF